MPTTTIPVKLLDLPKAKALAADFALALALLDKHTPTGRCSCAESPDPCPRWQAQELLARHGIREGEACHGSDEDADGMPMSEAELLLLKDLLGRWLYSAGHPGMPDHGVTGGALSLRLNIDTEMAERFGQ